MANTTNSWSTKNSNIKIFQIQHQQWGYVFIRLPKPLTARHGLSSVRNGQQKSIKNVIAE